MTDDPNAVLAKFVEQRQIKLDAEREKNTPVDERSGDNGVNPPAVRATDGGAPGTKEQNPLKLAAEADADNGIDDGEDPDDTMPTMTKAEIQKQLDDKGIAYPANATKAALEKLLAAN